MNIVVNRILYNIVLKSLLRLPTLYASYGGVEIVDPSAIINFNMPYMSDVTIATNAIDIVSVYEAVAFNFGASSKKRDLRELGYEMDMLWGFLNK